jgi:acetyltransferase-like isoleucine patch superfamily enzyme
MTSSTFHPRRLIHLADALRHYVRWRWRFHAFGWRSRLGPCDMLTHPRAISIGRNVLIRKGARLEAVGPDTNAGPKLIIGDGTAIQFYFHCGAASRVSIGRNVLMGGRVYITDHDHSYDEPDLSALESPRLKVAPVEIGDGAFLGEGCVILKGVRVGRRAVVAANAVVTRDVPDFAVVAGVPARVVKSLSSAPPGGESRPGVPRKGVTQDYVVAGVPARVVKAVSPATEGGETVQVFPGKV